MFIKLKRLLIGRPLASHQAHHELIPKWKALAVLSSDALSSVAYATEEILIPLSMVGALAMNYSIPIGLCILLLLTLVTLSYRQTIHSYPSGGGAYVVAKDNIGPMAGLVAGASLLIDYILTVSVSVAAGVENMMSAFPFLQEHMVLFGSVVIIILMVLSLRGMGESSTIFSLPCYMFIFSILSLVISGLFQSHSGEAQPVRELLTQTYPEISFLLLLRAFSSGCSALTGVEAISNGIQIFKEPKQTNAKITLTAMALLLGGMFAGITYLTHIYHLQPLANQTLISSLGQAVFGSNIFYYILQVSTALILFLAASTSYADFPRLCSLLAKDRYAPRQLAILGDRLVFSNGIVGLSFAAIFLLAIFGGRTHHLIPLYAVGVFLSFTLSQAGMVIHHLKLKEKGWLFSLFFNAIGAVATCVVLFVIAMSKFAQGAWMVILLIPIIVFICTRIHHHYMDFSKELADLDQIQPREQEKIRQIVVLPISGLHKGVVDAYTYACSISREVRVCIVDIDEEQTDRLKVSWSKTFGNEIQVLRSPFRSVTWPILKYLDKILRTEEVDFVTVILPEFITAKWYHQFLHNQTAFIIKAALIFKPRVVVTSVRYHLKTT